MEGNNINTELKAVELAVQIVTSHVSCTPVPSEKIPEILGQVHAKLLDLFGGQVTIQVSIPESMVSMADFIVPGEHSSPAIPVELSVRPDKLACLVCGEWFRLLRPHLKQAHGIDEQEYRKQFGLTKKYPLVAPEYSKFRAVFAKESGLGRK